MALWQGKSTRQASGGRYWAARSKKAREVGRDPLYTKAGSKDTRKTIRQRGGNKISSLTSAAIVNLSIGNKVKKSKVETVVENKASRHFVRQNVISKGAVIKTPDGLARVTSKPTRDGILNAVLIKK